MGKIIGRIVEVYGLSIKAELYELLPPYLISGGKRENAPRINGFIKTRIGLDTAVCQVVGEFDEVNDNQTSKHYLKLEVKGYFDNEKFVQGLRVLPIVSANIELLDSEDYRFLFASPKEEALSLGHDLYDDNKEVFAEVNKLILSHIGVFGNTGSGKSNTLTKILYSYYEIIGRYNTRAGKFLVFDLNNEYGSDAICAKDEKTIYKLSTRSKGDADKIPLKIDNLTEDDFVVLVNASQKTQAPAVKNAFRNMKDGREAIFYKSYLYNILTNSKRQLFYSMRHHLSSYISNVDNFKFHNKNSEFYYEDENGTIYSTDIDNFRNCVNRIEITIPEEPLDRFLFELYFSVAHEHENGVALDFMMPLLSRATKLIADFESIFDFSGDFTTLFKNKNVCVIQLAGVNKDMKEILPSIVANNIFSKLQNYKENKGEIKQYLNIVIDEAHNILYDRDKDVPTHESVIDTFEKVIKEGRKFGLFLMLASQRPSDISQTIISQLHNYFIHKLVNPSDIAMIRKAVAYMDERALDFITILAPGECIVSGTAFQMPTFIYVNQVQEKNRPQSDNIPLTGKHGLFNKKVKPTASSEKDEIF